MPDGGEDEVQCDWCGKRWRCSVQHKVPLPPPTLLQRIEEKQPKRVGSNLPWCGHLGANQYGCTRCAITRQDDELDRLRGDVVKLARALAWLADWAETDPDAPGELSAKGVAKRALEEVAGE